ncbi:class I adenylate-forming enzyme family protein [Lentibacillus sp. Marseille-P4043]|uniref:class I adenylate-forming enzyme family protein n=1 Tax=Lentibacillus sp. Marseille-P4043 TaxID=2040293 RepID=UPI000D0B4167|nr:AMP-binding protein [Lentibacillus sp. Marseille-P4043]
MHLTKLLEDNLKTHGEYPFLYFQDKSYTNKEVEWLSKKFSTYLQQAGLSEENIMVCLPNTPEVVFSYQGIIHSGNIVVPVMYLLTASEIRYILADSKTKVVITSSVFMEKIQEAVAALPIKPKIFLTDDEVKQEDYAGLEITYFYDAIDQANLATLDNVPANEDDVAVILYTSGTTGRPKGVMLSHKNLYASARTSALLSETDTKNSNVTVGVLPLAHIFGFTMMNALFFNGSAVVIFPKFDVGALFKAIETYRVEQFSVVPAMIYAMVADQTHGNYDLGSLENVSSGSAPLPIPIMKAFTKKINANVLEGYGLSEAAPVLTTHRIGEEIKPGSVGRAIPGVEVKVVDEAGIQVPVGEIGEVIARGDNIFLGYYQLEEETERTIRNGWLYTGDMGKLDKDGYLYIVDRKKDIIIRGGFNIYPRDTEELLAGYEGVQEVAVVGVPDEKMGEIVVACVVKKEAAELTETELIDFTQQKLAKYKTPSHVVFMERLPRNGVGKILKNRLRDLVE